MAISVSVRTKMARIFAYQTADDCLMTGVFAYNEGPMHVTGSMVPRISPSMRQFRPPRFFVVNNAVNSSNRGKE